MLGGKNEKTDIRNIPYMLLCEIKPHFWAVSAFFFLARFLPHLLLLSLTVESVTGSPPPAMIRKLLRNGDDGWRQLELVLHPYSNIVLTAPGCCGCSVVPNEGRRRCCTMKDAQVQEGWSLRGPSVALKTQKST